MQHYLFVVLLCGIAALDHSHEEHTHKAPHYKYSEYANLHAHEHLHAKGHSHDRLSGKLTRRSEPAGQIWTEVSIAVLLISLVPLLVLCLLPNLQKHRCLLKLLLAFAAGGLLGDAFLHLIPHAIEATQSASSDASGHRHGDDAATGEPGHTHHHGEHTKVGLSILFGIFAFLCVEKVIRLARGGHHSHHATQAVCGGGTVSETANREGTGPVATEVAGSSGDVAKKENSSSNKKKKASSGNKKSQEHHSAKEFKTDVGRQSKELKVATYLNLTADFMHNFTDGLAMGASFLMSRSLGIVTTLTVLVHELPHEIGDYAILVQSGCSSRKAILLQMTTAIGAALGAALSLVTAGVGMEFLAISGGNAEVAGLLIKASTWLADGLAMGYLLAFTAGGFIYIAMTSVLPDLFEENTEESSGQRQCLPGFWHRLLQTVGELSAVTAGVLMMVILGRVEETQGQV